MKKIATLTFLGLISLFINNQAFACSCVSPNFTDEQVQEDVQAFMKTKRNVEFFDIVKIEQTQSKYYVPRIARALVNLFTLGEDQDFRGQIRACEMDCISWHHQNRVYDITYMNEGELCVQELFVNVKSNVFNNGYKIKLKKKTHPVCN